MSNENFNSETKTNCDQYGKKGFKPRKSSNRPQCDLDKIATNDPKYWNKSKNFENVSKFTWDLIVGYPRNWDYLLGATYPSDLLINNDLGPLNPAQIMAIDVVMGPGWANDVNDGVNRSLAQLMARIRSTLSTSNIGFETADLGYLLTSTSSIASNIAYAKRVLESFTLWKDRNYLYPRMLIKMMGFDYEDIRDNIQHYAAKLNALIDMYNHIGLLDVFDTYERQYAMMHNVFCDEDSSLAQLYIFKPANYYIYEDINHLCRSYAFELNPTDTRPFALLLNIITDQINAWYGSSDLYQINGVVLRAFKDAPRQLIPYFEMGTQVEPVQDKAFLMQIMNCTICPIDLTGGGLDIRQDPNQQNFVIWRPAKSLAHLRDEGYPNYIGTCLADKQVLRLFDTDISPDDNIEMTRLMTFGTVINGDTPEDSYIQYQNCGSEIVTNISVAAYDSVADRISALTSTNSNILSHAQDSGFNVMVQAFRYIPTFLQVDNKEESPNIPGVYAVRPEGIVGDIYNWMVYDKQDWNLLQFSALQSLWTPKNI